jgi:replicative DNA helicase
MRDEVQGVVVPREIVSYEELLIGNCMNWPVADRVAPRLRPEDFSVPKHQEIWRCIRALVEQGVPVCAASLERAINMTARGAGFGIVLIDLVLWQESRSGAQTASDYYVQRIQEASGRRRLYDLNRGLSEAILQDDRDPKAIAEDYSSQILQVRTVDRASAKSREELSDLALQDLQAGLDLKKSGRRCLGLETGFGELDEFINGLNPGDYTLLAGRPSLGKTTLALQMAIHVASKEGRPVVIASLEMSARQVASKLACILAGVSHAALLRGNLSEQDLIRYTGAAGKMATMPLTVEEVPAMTAADLKGMMSRQEAALWIVDHLHLMDGSGDSQNERMANISRQLRSLALAQNTHILALAQLSRKPEDRPDKMPQMADLRDSGGIEQDAVNILLIHRPGFYPDIRAKAKAEDRNELVRTAYLLVPKNRFGPTGHVSLAWIPERAIFGNQTYQREGY